MYMTLSKKLAFLFLLSIIALLLVVAFSSNDAEARTVDLFGDEKYCTWSSVNNGQCVAGDLLLLKANPKAAVEVCSFDDPVVVIGSHVICTYSGMKRSSK